MKHYFRIVEKESKYQFVLIPGTNIHLAMGYSALYDSEKECIEACKHFKEIVKSNPLSSFSRINTTGPDCVSYEFLDTDGSIIFSNTYKNAANAKNSMRLIIQYINSQIM